MEKTDLDITAVDTDKWQYILEQSFSAFKTAEDISAANNILWEISSFGCTAVKSSLNYYAEQCFNAVLQAELFKVSADIHLNCLKNMLIMAARMRQKDLFNNWLALAEPIIKQYLDTKVYASYMAEFLKPIIFIVCDRRYTESFKRIRNFLLLFAVRTDDMNIIKNVCSELTSLITQIAKRNWQEVTDFLINTLLYVLLKKNNLELMKYILLQLNMHYQMYSRWDGLDNAYRAYNKLHIFFYILINKAGNKKIDYEIRKQYLLLALRNMRDLIANISRTSMQDELQIIRRMYELLTEQASGKMQYRAQRFIQLEIRFWNLTKPKTSRKQLAYLHDLLEKQLITAEDNELLLQIS